MSFRGFGPGRGQGNDPQRGRGAQHRRGAPSEGPPVSSAIQQASQPSAHNRTRSSSQEKKKKQRESLGSQIEGQSGSSRRETSASSPKTHLLIVQGGSHTAFIGDFLALIELFRTKISPKFAADFWTAYSPEDYFADFSQFNDIKFAGNVMATRFRSTHYDPPYSKVDPTQICSRVYQWLGEKSTPDSQNRAASGDSIIIIFLAHGVFSDAHGVPLGMRLGNNDLLVTEFVAALQKIPRDVQVNILSNACFSAIFAQNVAADAQANRWIQVASQPLKKAFAADRSVSGRLQNSTFISGLVRSLAGLGKNNLIDVATLQADLKAATEAPTDPKHRSVPFSYTDAPLETKVHSLLLRTFADFPLTPQNSAARRRLELNVTLLKRPFPESAGLMDKVYFAAEYIKEEHESFCAESTDADYSENNFESLTRSNDLRENFAGVILKGMLLRGRFQAAVFGTFMHLCMQGVCSLNSLKYPVDWNERGLPDTCFSWICRLLSLFNAYHSNWHATQEEWEIKGQYGWESYHAPIHWLAVMIGRTFTSLDVVFDIINATQQLGKLDHVRLREFVKDSQPDQKWQADINLNVPDRGYGSGTFAFWLPFGVNANIIDGGFDNAARTISNSFYARLRATELQYSRFFDIDEDTLDADVINGERDVRDWKGIQ